MAERNVPKTGDNFGDGVVKNAVGVAGGYEVTVVVNDESDPRPVDAGVPDTAKFGVQDTNGPVEQAEVNAERYAETRRVNEEAQAEEEKAQRELADVSDSDESNPSNADDKDSAGAKTAVNSVSGGTPTKNRAAAVKHTNATNEKLASESDK